MLRRDDESPFFYLPTHAEVVFVGLVGFVGLAGSVGLVGSVGFTGFLSEEP